MSKKYVEAVPLYPHEQQLPRYGYDLSRQTLSNRVVHSSALWLRPRYLKMKGELVRKDVLHADEKAP